MNQPQDQGVERTSGGANADAAVTGSPTDRDRDPGAAPAQRAEPLGESKHDQLASREDAAEDRQEALVDEGVEETFPASDPVSVKRIT